VCVCIYICKKLYIKTEIWSIINKIKEVGRLELICPFQSEFSTLCNLVLYLSVSSILSYPSGHQVSAHVCLLVFPVCLSLHTHTHTYISKFNESGVLQFVKTHSKRLPRVPAHQLLWYLLIPCLITLSTYSIIKTPYNIDKDVMTLTQQMEEISQWNTQLISCTAQI